VARVPRTNYRRCWELQQRLFDLRSGGMIGDTLILTEHDPVYTIGNGGDQNHLLASPAELSLIGADVVATNRGGDITYHGPGQLVGYPILDLTSFYRDLHRYLRDLEEVVIRTLARFGVKGGRAEGYTGVWIGNEKICALGVRTSRWVTMHGFALNVSTDLKYFDRIIPCGIFEKGVTSLEAVVGHSVSLNDVIPALLEEFSGVFGVECVEETLDQWLAGPTARIVTEGPAPSSVGQGM
jgi:lipoyl(octanoyl) transferase